MTQTTDTETQTTPASDASEHRRHLVRNTAFFSFATALSRIAGLAREVVAASKFGVTGPMSAFTIAYQVPNVLRALFAEGPLQAGFVPVFTELLERGEKREAFRVASVLFWLICLVMGALTAIFVLVAPVVMPLFAPGFHDNPELKHLTVHFALTRRAQLRSRVRRIPRDRSAIRSTPCRPP